MFLAEIIQFWSILSFLVTLKSNPKADFKDIIQVMIVYPKCSSSACSTPNRLPLFYPQFFTNVVNSCLFMFAPSILLVEAAETPLFDNNNSYHLNCSMLKIPILTSVPSCTCHFLPQPQFFSFPFSSTALGSWGPDTITLSTTLNRNAAPATPKATSEESRANVTSKSPLSSRFRSKPSWNHGYPWDNHGSIAIGHFFGSSCNHDNSSNPMVLYAIFMGFSWENHRTMTAFPAIFDFPRVNLPWCTPSGHCGLKFKRRIVRL